MPGTPERPRTTQCWQGRYKGIAEFDERTHEFNVNANEVFLRTLLPGRGGSPSPTAFHRRQGEFSDFREKSLRFANTYSRYNPRA